MAAIVTSSFRKDHAVQLAQNGDLYIGFGKSDPWPVPTVPPLPSTSPLDIFDVKQNLIGIKRVTTTARVVPRVVLTAGRSYKVWDSSDASCLYPAGTTLPCYAFDPVTFRLYMCVRRGPGTVSDITFVDTLTTYGMTAVLGDGYRWAYLGQVDEASTFLTTQFIELPPNPVGLDSTAATAATGGKLLYVKVLSGGSGYPSSSGLTNMSVLGDGSGAVVNVITSGGRVTDFTVTSEGSGYSFGRPDLGINGSGARYVPVFAPKQGFGANLLDDLPSWFVGIGADISSLDSDIVLAPYRQVSIIDTSGHVLSSDSQGLSTLRKFTHPSDLTTALRVGDIIEGNTSKALAFVDSISYEGGISTVKYHQNSSESVNFKPFVVETIRRVSRGSENISGNITLGGTPEYQGEGNVIFFENFKVKSRTSNQSEEVRIIIQL